MRSILSGHELCTVGVDFGTNSVRALVPPVAMAAPGTSVFDIPRARRIPRLRPPASARQHPGITSRACASRLGALAARANPVPPRPRRSIDTGSTPLPVEGGPATGHGSVGAASAAHAYCGRPRRRRSRRDHRVAKRSAVLLRPSAERIRPRVLGEDLALPQRRARGVDAAESCGARGFVPAVLPASPAARHRALHCAAGHKLYSDCGAGLPPTEFLHACTRSWACARSARCAYPPDRPGRSAEDGRRPGCARSDRDGWLRRAYARWAGRAQRNAGQDYRDLDLRSLVIAPTDADPALAPGNLRHRERPIMPGYTASKRGSLPGISCAGGWKRCVCDDDLHVSLSRGCGLRPEPGWWR